MTRWSLTTLLAAVLLLGTASAPHANAQQAAIEGVARAEDGGAPVPFALVRLVPADSSASPSGTALQGITSADGRYRFGGLAAGRYRVQLLPIGFRPVLSDPVQVAAGETVQLPLRVLSQPLRMPVGGAFAMRPSRKNPARRTEGKLTFTYSGFEEVLPR